MYGEPSAKAGHVRNKARSNVGYKEDHGSRQHPATKTPPKLVRILKTCRINELALTNNTIAMTADNANKGRPTAPYIVALANTHINSTLSLNILA